MIFKNQTSPYFFFFFLVLSKVAAAAATAAATTTTTTTAAADPEMGAVLAAKLATAGATCIHLAGSGGGAWAAEVTPLVDGQLPLALITSTVTMPFINRSQSHQSKVLYLKIKFF